VTVKEIVAEYLKQNGFDGLCHSETECGCELADLAPCDCFWPECKPGYKRPPRADLEEDTDAEWVIGPQKPERKRTAGIPYPPG